MDIIEVTMMHHVGIVLMVLWLLSLFNRCHPLAYFLSLIYLFLVHERYVMRLRKKLRYEERRKAHQKRMLSDSETVLWLNHTVEKIWPVCMEQVVSQKILLPIIPWFLDKYKPWTVKKAVVQHMYLGRNPPLFTAIRVLQHSTGDDHLVLELGMSLCTADDMSAILAVQLSRRLGFGMWTKLHITGMHVEGKVLVGVKFLRNWPFLGRLRVCFVEPPYFQMTVKPFFTHGLDVTEVPGIAGWLDNLLLIAFEQTLVQPNMLVVDVEKFVSPGQDWFSVDEKEPIAYAKVEVVEASDMKRSDLNGLADPYVKGQLGPHKFRTKIQKRTLSPKWVEEFVIPISTWESPNVLAIEVRDKDHIFDDNLGECTVNINDLRDGERHDMWLNLENIKMGRLHLAITVLEVTAKTAKDDNNAVNGETLNKEETQDPAASETRNRASVPSESSGKSQKVADNLEPIDIEGQEKTGIWVYHPGSEVSQTWEPRKGKSRHLDNNIHRVPGDSFSSNNLSASGAIGGDDSSSDESLEGKKRKNMVKRGLHKIGSVFHRNPKNEDELNNVVDVQSPYANIKSVNQKEIGVKLIVEDDLPGPTSVKDLKEMNLSPEATCSENPGKVKGMAKNILKQARSIKHALSRKGSNKSQSGSSQLTERDIGLESDSSADESLTSPQDRRVPAALSPIMSSSAFDDLEETKENIAQTGLTEVAIKTEVSGAEDEVSGTNTSGNGGEESAESVPAKGNLEEEK